MGIGGFRLDGGRGKMSSNRYSRCCGGLALSLSLVIAGVAWHAHAQSYPSRLLRIIVPTSASTPPDIISRITATALSESEGWSMVVENKPGAVQTLGAVEVLRQPADGYSMLAVGTPVTAAQSIVPRISFNLNTDFAGVVQVTKSGNVLVVNPAVPATTIDELVAYLKQNPDKLTYSSGGFGTPAHLIGELFRLNTGVRVTHVPYNDFPRAISDLVQGVNTYQFITVLPVVGLIQTGKLRALAVTSPQRVPTLPEVPTVSEAGHPELTTQDWVGLSVRAGTPPEAIARLNAAVNKVLALPKVGEALEKIGSEPAGGSVEQYTDLVRSQVALWAKVVNDAGLKLPQ
jgi:tripartite-type tricarboxylate transporter receptor subunit TctC